VGASLVQYTEQQVLALQQECRSLSDGEPGEAKATRAYRLPARFVVHTAGPVWRPRRSDGTEQKLLAGCYRRSLEVAARLGMKSIAFSSPQYSHVPAPKRARRRRSQALQ